MQNCVTKNLQSTADDLAVSVIQLYRTLVFMKKEFIVSKKLLRSACMVFSHFSQREFCSGLISVLETKLWLEIIKKSILSDSIAIQRFIESADYYISQIFLVIANKNFI